MSNNSPQEPTDKQKLEATLLLIERYNGGMERRLPWDQIRNSINLITESHLFLGANLPDQVFYRGRLLKPGEHFDHTDSLKAPPNSKVTSYGRCNLPSQSVLYASSNLETVLSELGAHSDDRFQILECRPKKGSEISATIVGEIDHVRRYSTHSNATGPGYADEIRKYWTTLNSEQRLRLNLVDAFIAEKFKREIKYSFEYKITSAFSDIIFSQNIDSFFYPSVGHVGGLNIAIQADVAEKGFEYTASKILRVSECLGYGIFGCIEEAHSRRVEDDGTITF